MTMGNCIEMPELIKETSSGWLRHPIQDALFAEREVECVGEITPELAHSIIMQLRWLQRQEPEKEITLYINSPGGEVSSGLAVYDVMQAVSCPVRTVCVGSAASMAAVLFLSGDKRDILPHGKLMIHDPLIPGKTGGSALEMERASRELMKTREILGGIIAKHTGKSLEEVYAKTAKDSWFDAEESVAWGLADRVITTLWERGRDDGAED